MSVLKSVGQAWYKSSYSAQAGDCVETRIEGGGVAVRDSKAPTGPVFVFDRQAWESFVAAVRDGEIPSV
ncbi:DUF397 domain-containing protein [Kitasatospora sp. NPDC004240]